MDHSWAWRSQCIANNPFGSFRQNGSFPASLISGSVTSRHLGAPPSDYTSSESESNSRLQDDSTHLYINMLDRSDLGAIKSTKFWCDSAEDDASDEENTFCDDARCDDDSSEFSSIHSDDEFTDDHRGHVDYDITSHHYQQSALTPRDRARDPVVVSLSNAHRLTTKPPMVPRTRKSTKAPLTTSVIQKDAASSARSKVGPWLQKLDTSSYHSSSSSCTVPEVFAECSVSSVPSAFDSDCGISHSANDQSSTTQVTTPSNTMSSYSGLQHNEFPSASDASSFMQKPLVMCDLTARRPRSTKRSRIGLRIRKLRRFFTRTAK